MRDLRSEGPMLRPALVTVGVGLMFLAACGGTAGSTSGASSPQPCTPGVCGAAGSTLTVKLATFRRDTGTLRVEVGASAESFAVDGTTQPLPTGACTHPTPVSGLIDEWNSTQPMDPMGQFDISLDDRGDAAYQRVLAELADAGASASITLAPDMTTVRRLRPLCAPGA